MIKYLALRSKNIFFITLIGLMGVCAHPAYSRTLVFQSSTDTDVNKQDKNIEINNAPVHSTQQTKAPLTTAPVLASNTSANSELFFMIEQLQNEVNLLRGMLEEQSNELRMLKRSGKDRYLDLDARMLDLTKQVSLSVTPAPTQQPIGAIGVGVQNGQSHVVAPVSNASSAVETVVAPKPASQAEQDAYNKAYALIKDKKFDESIVALFNYTENYPESPLMANVYYWLGEVYLATSKLEQAKTSFTLVVSAYPTNPKASDSLYKLAVTLDRLGENDLAKKYLNDVQEKYPNSSAAKLASKHKISE